jgi:peroxiredoxin
MTIKVGDQIPAATLVTMQDGQPTPVDAREFFKGKKVALFGVPGAFTPTCSIKHLPGFVKNAGAFKAKGVDAVVCVAVNDIFVLDAWAKDQKAGDGVVMASDGSGRFAKATGLELDLTEKGLGIRNLRFSAFVDNGVVKALNVEQGGAFDVSSAEKLLAQI